ELREGEPLDVVLPRDPAALVDEVALHVADERDRSAEAECAEAEEIAEQLTEAARRRRGRHRLGRGGRWGDGHGLFPSGATVRPSNSVTESAFVHSPTLRRYATVWSCASTTFSTALHASARDMVCPSGPLSSEVLVEVVEDGRPSGQPILVFSVPHGEPGDQAIDPRRFRAVELRVLQVDVMDDRCDRAKRRVVEAQASEQHLERAEVTFMRELGLEHVEAQLAGLRPIASGRHELESCPGVDETPEQPSARDAVDVNSLARDPGAPTEVPELPAIGHRLHSP